eukprot:5061296-Ditylum_brightwellii.AAC.1
MMRGMVTHPLNVVLRGMLTHPLHDSDTLHNNPRNMLRGSKKCPSCQKILQSTIYMIMFCLLRRKH